ncbi:MAG: prevent-host-death family protein [Chthonomonadales bacterium]|nr:prevent-host-death family protein [Chthonomonadales bacterium]
MINLHRDIHSLTEFKRNTNDFMKQMKETKVPVVLTVNGKAELVVQDAESYQIMLERLERVDAIEAIQRGLEQMERGEGRPAEEVFAEFRARHGIPNA